MADLEQVAVCAAQLRNHHGHLEGLVCNAGVMGGPLLLSAQGYELQMATNHLGHAALVAGLWPLLSASGSRIVLVSSGEARGGNLSPQSSQQDLLHPDSYDGKQVYRNSKQANLLFALELHRRCSRAREAVTVAASHPGAVATDLFAHQLRRAGRRRLATASKTITSVALPSAAGGARSTLTALDLATPSGSFVGPRGLGQLRGAPTLLDVYDSASDPATGARLWALTQAVPGCPLELIAGWSA